MTNFDTVREALESCEALLTSMDMQHLLAYKELETALTTITAIEADHYSAADMATASADGFRAGVAAYREATALMLKAPQQAAPVAQQPQALSRDRIREIFMTHGFTIKDGQTDLKEYVYEAAAALLAAAQQPQAERKPLFADLIAQHPGLREELKAMDDPAHPLFVAQAEAAKSADLLARVCDFECEQAEAVPPGYVLVPVEPTEEMKDAAMAYVYNNGFTRGDGPGAVYRAMLTAAQGAKT